MGKTRGPFSPKKQAAFLAAYVASATIRHACEASGISGALHYYWLEKDPTYAERFKAAQLQSCLALEEEARRRAYEGVRKYKFTAKGEAILHPETGEPYYEHAYSDALLLKLLEANNPEKFGRKVETTVNGNIQHIHTIEKIKAALDEARRDPAYVDLQRRSAVLHANNAGHNGSNGVARALVPSTTPSTN